MTDYTAPQARLAPLLCHIPYLATPLFLLHPLDSQLEIDARRVIALSARVHPGESNASFMMRRSRGDRKQISASTAPTAPPDEPSRQLSRGSGVAPTHPGACRGLSGSPRCALTNVTATCRPPRRHGILDFLTGPSAEADALRRQLLFVIVPMLNPDGVIIGNYRYAGDQGGGGEPRTSSPA